MTSEEAGEYLRVHPKTVNRYARQGVIRARRLGKKLWRYRKSDLDAFSGSEIDSDRQPYE